MSYPTTYKYIPQSPKPHSPPQTPSPTSPKMAYATQPISPQPMAYPTVYNLDSPLLSSTPERPSDMLPVSHGFARTRSTSPRPPPLNDTTASSSSVSNPVARERVVSPTQLTGFLDGSSSDNLNNITHNTMQNLYGQSSPTEYTPSPTPSEYSPNSLNPNGHTPNSHTPYPQSSNGKKETFVKPPLHLNAYTYDDQSNPFQARARAPYEASPSPTHGVPNHGGFPLSGANGGAFGAAGGFVRSKSRDGSATVGLEGGLAARWRGFYDSAGYWLILYFFFNLGLTLFNKVVLVSFPFPYVSCLLFWPRRIRG
jgi:hypothetical protein